VVEIPLPEGCEVPGWRLPVLPASYVNFLVVNGGVLVTTFRQCGRHAADFAHDAARLVLPLLPLLQHLVGNLHAVRHGLLKFMVVRAQAFHHFMDRITDALCRDGAVFTQLGKVLTARNLLSAGGP